MIRSTIVIALLLTACAATPPPDVPRAAVFDRCGAGVQSVGESVVKILTDRAMCTGVVISSTEVLTAGHCLEGVEHAAVVVHGVKRYAPQAIIDGPLGEDVALMIVDVSDVPPARVGASAYPGQVLVSHGFGCAHDTGARRMLQSRPRTILSVHAHNVAGCACGGDSGGPAFNMLGELVGVVTHTNYVDSVWITDSSVLPYLRAAASVEFGHVPMIQPAP